MTPEEALNILGENAVDFDIEDAGFGDGAHSVNYKYVFDTKAEAQDFVEAIKKACDYFYLNYKAM